MAKNISQLAPRLWSLLDLLLSANEELIYHRERKRKQGTGTSSSQKRARPAVLSSFDGELEMAAAGSDIPENEETPQASEAVSAVEGRSKVLNEV
ncbi:hypothetical protein C0991_004148, partial [Blastosporella zonata]